jgi:competence protein ComFC
MVRTLNTLLQLLWPLDSTATVTHNISLVTSYKNTRYLFSYKEPDIQTLIKRTKYQADEQAAQQLAKHLDTFLDTLREDYVIIPMPVSYKRWRERGYNHIELICKHSKYATKIRSDILKKIHHTKQQTQVSKIERIQQQRGTFSCNKSQCQILPSLVILLDDVTTTGATMDAARSVILPHLPTHAKLICLSIAH